MPPSPTLTNLLTQLEETHLLQRLEEVEAAYQFQHSLTRESAYGSLLRKQRRDLHRRVAECYEQIYPARLEEFSEQLAYHLDEAGEARAWRYHRLAGDAALRRYANTEAIAHYERALALVADAADVAIPDHLHIFLRLGRAMELQGRYDAALANYAALEQTGRIQGRPPLVLAGLVEQCQLRATPSSLFDAGEAERLAALALELAAKLEDRAAEARVYWCLLNVGRFTTGRLEQASEYGERALVLARQLGLRDLESYILNDMADLYLMAGRPHRGRDALVEAGAIFRELGNLPMLADSLSSLSGFESFVGHDDKAIALSNEAFAISQSIANVWGQAYSRLLIGYVYWDRGDPQQAITITETAIRHARESGFAAGTAISGALLGLVYAELGAFDLGWQIVEAGWQAVSGIMDAFAPALLTARAILSLEQGDLAAAEAALASLQDGEQTLNPFLVIFYRSVPARIALAKGRFEEALARTEKDLAALADIDISRTTAEILLMQAHALLGLGRLQEARPVLHAAIEDANGNGYRRLLWRLQAALARLEAADGNAAAAESLLAQARAHLAFIVGNITDPGLAASFRGRPEVLAVLQP